MLPSNFHEGYVVKPACSNTCLACRGFQDFENLPCQMDFLVHITKRLRHAHRGVGYRQHGVLVTRTQDKRSGRNNKKNNNINNNHNNNKNSKGRMVDWSSSRMVE